MMISDRLYHVLELPELVYSILFLLPPEERAKARLINSTFNRIYLVEEPLEFIKLWDKYRNGLAFGYNEKTVSDRELEKLQQKFEIPCLQFHLKVWLTKCSNGRFECVNTLLSIANIGDWKMLSKAPILKDDMFMLRQHFGEEMMKNLIYVHSSWDAHHIMDKRNGQFYVSYIGFSAVWEKLGNINEWLLYHIQYDIIYPLSKTKFGSIIPQLDECIELSKNGSLEEFLDFFKNNLSCHSFLSDDLKRNDRVLALLTRHGYNPQNCYPLELAAGIPFELRNDKQTVMKYFSIHGFERYLPTDLYEDREFYIELLTEHGCECFSLSYINRQVLNDIRVLELMRGEIIQSLIQDDTIHGLELDTIEKVLLFKDCKQVYPYISDHILHDPSAITEILRNSYPTPITESDINENLLDEEPLLMTLVSLELRNNKEFMEKRSKHCLLFMGEELRTDLDLLSNAEVMVLKRLNPSLTKEEYYKLFEKIEMREPSSFLNFFSFGDLIPREYFDDPKFCLRVYELSPDNTLPLFGPIPMSSVEFWRNALEISPNILSYNAPHEIHNDADLILNLDYISLLFCSNELRNNIAFLKAFFLQNSSSEYIYLSQEIRSNKELLISLIERGFKNLQFSSGDLINDPDIIQLMSQYINCKLFD